MSEEKDLVQIIKDNNHNLNYERNRKMNEIGCAGQKESPVYQQLKLIDERLNELSKTSDKLSGRLGNILSETQPTEGQEAEKAHCESALEGTLLSIRQRIETEISRLQNITVRLTI